MSETYAKLLTPLSEEQPCGPDLSYDPRLDAIEALLKGKPEVEMGKFVKPAEPPDWGALRNAAEEFLGQCRHLRVAVIFTCALVKTQGLTGYRDGVCLLAGLVERSWPRLYPLLDPDDNNDPVQRLNLLGALNARPGSTGSWLDIQQYLATAPLTPPAPGAPPVSYNDLEAAKKRAGGDPSVGAGASLVQLEAAVRALPAEQLVARHAVLTESIAAVRALDAFLTTTLGSGNTISFEDALGQLGRIANELKRFLPAADAAGTGTGGDVAATAGAGPAGGGGAAGIDGPVRSREDVVRVIDRLCEYYRLAEPGSPVPFVLRRAQKMATMNFVELVQELNVATTDTLRPAMGSSLDSLTPPAPS